MGPAFWLASFVVVVVVLGDLSLWIRMRQKKKEIVENERGSSVRLDDGVGPLFLVFDGVCFLYETGLV